MGSPFTAELIRAALDDYLGDGPVRHLLDAYPSYRRPGLNLAAALQHLALAGEPTLSQYYPSRDGNGDARAAWAAGRDILARDRNRFERMFMGAVQTNEVGRSTPVLGASLYLAAHFDLPLRIFEIGASAGLNLHFDRYRYDETGWSWGSVGSPLILRNRTSSGRPNHLHAPLSVVERHGCDLNPIDLSDEDGRLRLQSFVWPDQTDRCDQLQAAIDVATATPVQISAEGFLTWLNREVTCRAGYVTVVLHTVVEEHLSRRERDDLRGTVAALAEQSSSKAPLAEIGMELKAGSYVTNVRVWSDSTSETMICTSDGHARNIVWA